MFELVLALMSALQPMVALQLLVKLVQENLVRLVSQKANAMTRNKLILAGWCLVKMAQSPWLGPMVTVTRNGLRIVRLVSTLKDEVVMTAPHRSSLHHRIIRKQSNCRSRLVKNGWPAVQDLSRLLLTSEQ